MDTIYLDHNATTQPAPEVVAAMREVHEHLWANPSSVHRFGQQVRQRVELARQDVASLIHCRDRDLIFTCGGTESNNLALAGVLTTPPRDMQDPNDQKHRVLITTRIEHSAIREPTEALAQSGVRVVYLPVDLAGRVNPHDVSKALQEHAPAPPDASVVLVSVQWANNETGIIQPIDRIAEACKIARDSLPGTRIYLHTDATQAVGKIPIDVGARGASGGVDLLTLSAHKFHGPKGVGALFVRGGVRLWPQQHGGPQERQRRGGTENTAGIIAMGVAANLADAFLNDHPRIAELTAMRDRFERSILQELPGTVINPAAETGSIQQDATRRLWNTTNLGFSHLEAEAILLGLSERGVCASAGAACSSGSLEPSPVLLAMGVPEPVAHGSVRFSIGRHTTEPELMDAAKIVVEVVRRIRKTLPMGV